MNAKVYVYTTTMCEPCTKLKAWLAQRGIDYVEITKQSLGEPELAALRRQIMTVSRADGPTLPAACITIAGLDYWVSNHGLCEIDDMQEEILKVLRGCD